MVVDIVKGQKDIDLYKFKSDSNQIVVIDIWRYIFEGNLLQLYVPELTKKTIFDTLLKYDY